MESSVRRISDEIAAVLERNLRRELIREREAALSRELESVRAELSRLGATRPARPKARQPKQSTQPLAEPQAGGRPQQGPSARVLIVETLKRTRRPMTIHELTKAILARGWKSTRDDPSKTVDVALRHNPRFFRRVAPGTFRLVQ